MNISKQQLKPRTELVGFHSLAEYDSERFGPLLAVSDEGSAGRPILEAAYASAKARAFEPIDPLRLGIILDGERMTSAGEVPIGPPEYSALTAVGRGRLLLTTNVGVRVNGRLAKQLPEIPVTSIALADFEKWFGRVLAEFQPFIKTPDGRPRPLTARLCVDFGGPIDKLSSIADRIQLARMGGELAGEELHRFSVLTVFSDRIATPDQIEWIKQVIEQTGEAGFREVSLDGALLENARMHLGVQSVLNIIDIPTLRTLLPIAAKKGVRLTYRYQLDVETAARTIWTGLEAARSCGFDAGKYGMVPLTLEEQAEVMELIGTWTSTWTAIPAFYVDTPLLTADNVYDSTQCETAAKLWLKTAHGAGATLVLFDSPDRITPRHLVRETTATDDPGVLTIEQIAAIDRYAKDLGVNILWSGGVSRRQAFELAKRRVFGIFSTSGTAIKIPVIGELANDPDLAAENEPDVFGVRRMHAIIQGGFLHEALQVQNNQLALEIQTLVMDLFTVEEDRARSEEVLRHLDRNMVDGWQSLEKSRIGQAITTGNIELPHPVPADAVRVFRGKRLPLIKRPEFLQKLSSIFMPITVQIQRIYGLSAYLPAVLPEAKNASLPAELALVFYRTRSAYTEAKGCVGGRAYGDMHNLVFDVPNSPSEFPAPLVDKIETGKAYHVLDRSVDWQSGQARIFVGTRKASLKPQEFLAAITAQAAAIRDKPGPLDAAIFCVSDDWVAWWDHAPQATDYSVDFKRIVDSVMAMSARRVRVPESFTEPYVGVPLNAGGDFINFQFLRAFSR